MKIGIMQPYFFPYLGYWQLMKAVDKYVVYDDVNYIKSGWINRNAVLVKGKRHNINVILIAASPNKLINQICVNTDERVQKKLFKTISEYYSKAPFYAQVKPILEKIIFSQEPNLAKYLFESIKAVATYLQIHTELMLSSQIAKDNSLKGYKKVIEISKALGGTEYLNSFGGFDLYEPHRAEFLANGIVLRYLKMKEIVYPQFNNEFVPNLSIIDVMMFNSPEEIKKMLGDYTVINSEGQA